MYAWVAYAAEADADAYSRFKSYHFFYERATQYNFAHQQSKAVSGITDRRIPDVD